MLALPGVSAGQVVSGDSAVGSGVFVSGGANQFQFNVTSGPSGENPSGSASIFLPFLPIPETFSTTAISCLSVNANAATFVGPLAANSFGFGYLKITVVDNGPTGDVFGVVAHNTLPACTPIVPFEGVASLGSGPIASGTIVVHDAAPVPSSREQCKNGGWAQFGFTNQGQCVGFVERGPKP